MESQLRPKVKLIPQKEARSNTELCKRVNKMIEEAIKEKAHFPLLGEWEGEPAFRNLYIILNEDKNSPVGLIGWTGPPDEAMPAWWIRSDSRRKGYGKRTVEVLAEEMVRKGITKVGDILIDAETEGEQVASRKLARHLKRHFNKLRP